MNKTLLKVFFLFYVIFLSFPVKSQYHRRGFISEDPELGFNIPSTIEKTADLRLIIVPNNDVSIQIGAGGMFNNTLKGSFQAVQDGTSNWSNSGYYCSAGFRLNGDEAMQSTEFYAAGKVLGGYFIQSCDYLNPVTNATETIKENGFFTAFLLEGGINYKIDNSLSMDIGLQVAVPNHLTSNMASASFSVLPGMGPILIGAKPRLLLILAPKFTL